jgi:hypothetical protein
MRIKLSTRLVFLIGKRVYKFPLSRRGYLQCKNEKKMWDSYNHTGVLGNLIWERFGIICMQRYIQCTEISDELVKFVKDKIPEFDIERCDLYNYKNWGTEDNRIYLIDYGISQYISTLYKC